MTQLQEWRAFAEKAGEEAAKSVASWITDGNDTDESRRRKLQLLEDGEGDQIIRYPSLSGEYGDDATPQRLTWIITGLNPPDPEIVDELAEAWEEGVRNTFQDACVAELNRWLH